MAFAFAVLAAAADIAAAKNSVAVIVPETSAQTERYVDALSADLGDEFKMLDRALVSAAIASAENSRAFNLSIDEAALFGEMIGCDHMLIVRTKTLRRTLPERPEYYESFAFVYVVNGRDGRLNRHFVYAFEMATETGAERALLDSTKKAAGEIAETLRSAVPKPASEIPNFEEPPAEDPPERENFHPPLPFKRLRPKYTELADRYGIEATVDVAVDIDAEGNVVRTDIVRWAGFGLDEAVIDAILSMNWRSAERSGRFLPMRVLLRYNFKDIPDSDR